MSKTNNVFQFGAEAVLKANKIGMNVGVLGIIEAVVSKASELNRENEYILFVYDKNDGPDSQQIDLVNSTLSRVGYKLVKVEDE